MWNSQLEQHLDQFIHNDDDDDSTTIQEENGDEQQQTIITTVMARSCRDENYSCSLLLVKRENDEETSSPASNSKRSISHPYSQATKNSFDLGDDEWRRITGRRFMVVFMLSSLVAVVVIAVIARWVLAGTTTAAAAAAAAAAANGTCGNSNSSSRNIILSWLGIFATFLCTFLAGWHGGKISIRDGGCQSSSSSSHHEEQKSVQKSNAVVHQQAMKEEESLNEQVDHHHRRVVVDDKIFISKSPAAAAAADCPSSYRHQQLRLRLVELLGTIGAPPLVMEQDETSNINHHHHKRLQSGEESLKNTGNNTATVTTNNCWNHDNSCCQREEHQHDQLLIEFCEAQVGWIQTLDQALDLLRASTSIQFGGGSSSSSILRNNVVERIERAAVGRWRRCQRQATTTTTKQNIVTPPPLHLPLARIRRRCAEALQRHGHCLLSILLTSDIEDEVEEKEDCFEKEEIPFDDDVVRFKAVIDMNVITIHSLRLARDDLAVVLARIVDQSIKRHTCDVVSFSENHCAQQLLLQQATQQAREEEAYLSACCRFSPSFDNDDDEDNEGILTVDKSIGSCSDIMLDPLKQGVANLQMTTSSLQVALLSFQDAVLEQQQNAELGGREIIKDWWQRVDSLTRIMLPAKHHLEQVVLQSTSTSKGGNVDKESSNDIAIAGVFANNPTDDKQDFVADATQAVTTPLPSKHHHDELHSSKTLLFSGSGTVAIRKEKRFDKTTKSSTNNDKSYSASTSTIAAIEQSLIHELETYLRCMPAPEEVNVTESSTDPMKIPNDDNENNSVLNAETDVCTVSNDMEDAADQPCGLLSTCIPTQHHGLFLGELTSSIQKHSNNISIDYTDGVGEESGDGDHWKVMSEASHPNLSISKILKHNS